MNFAMNPSRDVTLRNDMISRDLTGSAYEPVPEEIRKTIPVEKAKEYTEPKQAPKAVEYDFIEEKEPMKQEQDPLSIAALKTIDWEARKDKQGNPIVYQLPAGDMGGKFEIAGINDRYHPEAFKAIAALPAEERAEAAAEYIRSYTAPLVSQLPKPMQAFAQDLAFNRGLGGAARYIQQGLKDLGHAISVDGKLGPKTLAAINKVQPRALMQAASQAQLNDEYRRSEIDPRRKKFIQGLENRIRNRFSTLGQI